MDYKETLLLPKTEFEMRGNLSRKEPGIQKHWDDIDLYGAMVKVRQGAPLFTLHDGPPYANGNIHIGHALNKILKDLLVRTKFMAGFQAPFIPGWDTHGLPIETAIQKLGVNRKEMPVFEFRKHCEAYALEQIDIQKADFKALGTVADYREPYMTLAKGFEAQQIRLFAKMALKGMIYKGLRPVYWSPSSESALAEAEIEYHNRKDPAIYVAFSVIDGKGVLDSDAKFLIWTTTPWTIPANLGISINADLEYALVATEKGNLVMLLSLVDKVMATLGFASYQVLNTYQGSELETITTQHPLYDRSSLVMVGDHVTVDAGTGCVHTAPDHGIEDFDVGQLYGLKPLSPVNEQGILTEVTGQFAGLTFEEANKAVTLALDEQGALLKMDWIEHSYPFDWRTKKPVIFRATTQWFASIDSVREAVLNEIENNIHWHPKWGQRRMYNMINDRKDWCISRQRAWGVPIPIIYTEDDQPIMEKDLFEHVAQLFDQHGSTIWFEKEAKDLLPEGYAHPGSPNGVFRKETDIMDVWFDSGSSHTAALARRGYDLPVDVYLEGSDQYRGWFNSSLIISTAVYGHAPYKNIVSHGFIMKEDGEKMSKSKGDALSPKAIMDTLGADVLRLWVASVDYQSDIKMSQDLLKQISEAYRKVRNTFRFMHGNLNDFSLEDNGIAISELSLLNRYVLNDIIALNDVAQRAYERFDFQQVTTLVINSLTNLMSAYYLDYTKDILYIEKADSRNRREIQTVIYHGLMIYSRLLAPILVHTTEELNAIFRPQDQSIHLDSFSDMRMAILSDEEKTVMAELFPIRESVFKALEEKRTEKVIGKSLEAHVLLHLSEVDTQRLQSVLGAHLAQWFIVSKVSFVDTSLPQVLGYEVSVEKVSGHVCPRCWNVVDAVNDEGLCPRCAEVLAATQ